MHTDKKADYYVGLDMGTGSLGGAVTDPQYHLMKVKGKDFWFVREYESAQPQLKRRTHRISRRKLQRHQVRIRLLRSYFAEDVLRHDPLFYIRQDNSKYYREDKDPRLTTKDSLFADPGYGDKEYYKEYPTIFHLRQALLKDKVASEERYSRLLYLALIHLFEHRGHFLLNTDSGDLNADMVKDAGETVMNYICESIEEESSDVSYKQIIEKLADKEISRSTKKDKIASLLGIKRSDKKQMELVKCLCGMDADARVMFQLEADEKIKVAFQQASFEEEKEEIEAAVGEEYFFIIESMKQLYDYSQLQAVLKGFDYLSDARVAMYNKHKEDLRLLKKVYKRDLGQEAYDRMFRSSEKGSYSAYCNSLNSTDSLAAEQKYRRNMKNVKERGKGDLHDRIKKDLKNLANEETTVILKEIELEQFLPKQMTGANGVIPNQVHQKEMKKILENAEKHLDFLKETDDSGYTVSERILMLFSRNIPYYVGPVGNGSKTGWAVRREQGQVLPWNMEQKIDMNATSERFITNLIRECTYLSGEKVLPKQSLLYEAYCVLNEINNLRINGKRIVPEVKQDIYKELFQGVRLGKKVTRKTLCSYLMNRGILKDESELSGIDKEVNAYLSSYGKMYAVFGERMREEVIQGAAEEIIYYGTIYGDSKRMFQKKLDQYISSGILTESQAKRIAGYKFKDWARISKSMLCLSGRDNRTGEILSLIRAMWEYNLNFMELLHSEEFTFKEELEKRKQTIQKTLSDFQFEDLDEYYYSVLVKRMIWQTVQALKEITQIMGHYPKRIFIEMTRTDEEKGEQGRKNSREKRLLKLYENIKDGRNWETEIKNASASGKLNSKKLYLYYLQMGKDAYTGNDIDIEDLFKDNRYDIDHIYPRSLTNDNNMENNLVLVSKKINEEDKQNDSLVPKKVRENPKVRELWAVLHKMGFMNDEKYNRLTSNEKLTDDQLAGFIERQLVETAQGAKGIADLLKSLMPGTEIVYVKARNVSDFRKEYKMLKSRLINDYHHAQDAYLNIVVGNVYFTKFTRNPLNYVKKEARRDGKNYNYNLYKMYGKDVVRNGEIAWVASKNQEPGTIRLVKEVMEKNTPMITRQTFEQKGELFNLQPVGKYSAKAENYVPLKAKDEKLQDVTKYGGYTSLKPSYFVFFEHGSEKKRKKCFEVVHSYYASQIKNKADLTKFLEEKGYKNPRVIAEKIKKNALIKYNGYFLYIVGMDARKNVEFSNATAMCLKYPYVQYICKLERLRAAMLLSEKQKMSLRWDEKVTGEKNLELYQELTTKHLHAIYADHPKCIGTCLENGESSFKLLGIEQQVMLLCDIVEYTSFQKGTFSLQAIGGQKEVGRIRISGNMTDATELKLIHYSITGMYKKEEDLLHM